MTASFTISAPLAVSVLIVQAEHLPESAIGIYTTLVYIGALFGTLMTPHVLTKLSVRTVQLAGLGGLAGGILMFGWLGASIPGLLAACVSLLFMGLIYGALVPASAQILSNQFPDRLQPLVVSIKQTGVPVGTAAGAIAAPLVVSGNDWSLLPICLAASCILIMVLVAPGLSGFATVTKPTGSASFRVSGLLSGFQIPALRRLMIVALVYGVNQAALTTFLVPALVWFHSLSVGQAAGYLAIATISSAVSRIGLGASASRFGHVYLHLGLIGLLSGVAWLLLLMPHPGFVRLVCGAILIGATAMGWNGLLLAQLATEAPGHQSVVAVAAGVSLAYLGVLIGPVLFAAILLASGSKIAAIVALDAAAVCVGAWLLWSAQRKQPNLSKGPDI